MSTLFVSILYEKKGKIPQLRTVVTFLFLFHLVDLVVFVSYVTHFPFHNNVFLNYLNIMILKGTELNVSTHSYDARFYFFYHFYFLQ